MSTTPGEPGDIPALPEKRKRNGTALIAVAAQGIDIQTVNFGDYTQANPALSQGQLDLNCG